MSCEEASGLCITEYEIRIGNEFNFYWNANQVPVGIEFKDLVLSLYNGDTSQIAAPCNITQFPLISTLSINQKRSGFGTVIIPQLPLLSDIIKTRNQFFLQLNSVLNVKFLVY